MSEKLTWLQRIQKESKEKRERASIIRLARKKFMKELTKKQKKRKKQILKVETKSLVELPPVIQKVEKKRIFRPEKIITPPPKKKEPACVSDMIISFHKGEEKGVTYFFNLLYPPLLYYATNLVNDEEISKDSISEAFFKAWERKEMFANEKHLKVWIYSVTRNACYQKWKCANKRLTGLDENELNISIEEDSVDHLMIKAEVYGELYKYIERLPVQCRKILQLLYFEKKSVSEICAKLDLAESTIKTQKARGLTLLRNSYGITKEQADANELKKVDNILKSEASCVSLGNRYGLGSDTIHCIRKNGVKNVKKMRKIV
jgi:RNA polymerase sigma-70 factor (ECF subfamily)